MQINLVKTRLCFLCLAALPGVAHATPRTLILDPFKGPKPSGHIVRLNTALLGAAENGDIALAKKLLASGADVNVIENESKSHTPLTYAAENGQVEMTRFLLRHGADANGRGVRLSPLFWTVANGEAECAELLLRGADPFRVCADDSRPIDYAAENGDLTMVQLLLAHMTGLSPAKAHLYRRRAANGGLDGAISEGTFEQVKDLVQAGADVNYAGGSDDFGVGSPLMRATFRGSVPILKYLLAHGAKVNATDIGGRSALMYSGLTVNNVSQPCASIPTDGHHAALTGPPTALLLRSGAKVGIRDEDGKTALMFAAEGNAAAVRLLLAAGARVNEKDAQGRTALHWAASVRDAKSLSLLLARGAHVNALDGEGASALMLASVRSDEDDPGSEREPKLHSRRLAEARRGHSASLKVLRAHGANAGLKDKTGRTAGDYAKLFDGDFISGT